MSLSSEPSTTVPQTCTPIMSWSQRTDTVSVVLSIRGTYEESCVSTTLGALQFSFALTSNECQYAIHADWFGETLEDQNTYKLLGNGDILVTLVKLNNEIEWPSLFAKQAYKSSVQIDWSRWEDDDSDNEDDDNSNGMFDGGDGCMPNLEGLTEASPFDFGGEGGHLPNEENEEFQDMMTKLQKMGSDS